MVSAISFMTQSPVSLDYGSNELVHVVLELFPRADSEMALALSVSAVALCQKASFAYRVGNPKRMVLIRKKKTALNASLGVAERLAGRKVTWRDVIDRNQPQGTGCLSARLDKIPVVASMMGAVAVDPKRLPGSTSAERSNGEWTPILLRKSAGSRIQFSV